MSKIVIQLEGGLVQSAFLLQNENFPGMAVDEVLVVDFDIEEADAIEITETRDKDEGLLEAIVHEEEVFKLKKGCDVDRLVNVFLEKRAVDKATEGQLPLMMPHLTTEEGRAALTKRLGQ